MDSHQPNQPNQPKKPIPQSEDILDYVKNHARETISYILLLAGILLLFFNPIYGGLLVGIIGGIYFGDEIVNYVKSISRNLQSTSFSKHLIILGVAVAFLICAPAIFIGAAISIGIQLLFNPPKA